MLPSFASLPFRLERNPRATPGAEYGERQRAVLNAEGLAMARGCVSSWPGYAPTPLVALPGLAAELGVGAVHYKQEGERFGLRSFKPLGGAYAVQRRLMRVVSGRIGREVRPGEILGREHDGIVRATTVTAATDGNHGRSVAWGARMFGCRCVIFVNEAVSLSRERAIAALGAEVRRNPGSYDDAVRAAAETAGREGWHVIPDTCGAPGGDGAEAPRDVNQGYAVMAAEAIAQLAPGGRASHMFLQAGVGGMAAAVCAQFWQELGSGRPTTVLVEPAQCACWLESLRAGRPVAVTGDIDSFMGGLACGEPSRLAWEILEHGADAAMALDDEAAKAAMRLLAEGCRGDPVTVGGESGVAGLAGLATCAQDPGARKELGLGKDSRVVVFGTEGATDEEVYLETVGRPWQEIAA